jgi:ribosomal protein L16 Arg81 hydroxylase
MIADLSALFAPEKPQLFRDHFIQKTRLFMKGAVPDRFVPLLPWTTINRLIESDTLPQDRVKIARANNAIAPALYRQPEPRNRLRLGKLQGLLHQGASVVLNGIDDFVPAIGRLTSAIERELACLVWCNAYLSFGAGSAFEAHYDVHDVIILQVHGRKRWRSHGQGVVLHPIEHHSRRTKHGDVVWEGTLEAGDLLYLPRGEVHAATLDGDRSVHLTIGMNAIRWLDFCESILKKVAEEDAIFRQDIPRVADNETLANRQETLKSALHRLIDQSDLANFLDATDRARALRPFLNLGIDTPYRANMIIESAVLRCVPLDTRTEGNVTISIGGDLFQLSSPARQVLDFLIRTGECTFSALTKNFSSSFGESVINVAVSELAKNCLVGVRG